MPNPSASLSRVRKFKAAIQYSSSHIWRLLPFPHRSSRSGPEFLPTILERSSEARSDPHCGRSATLHARWTCSRNDFLECQGEASRDKGPASQLGSVFNRRTREEQNQAFPVTKAFFKYEPPGSCRRSASIIFSSRISDSPIPYQLWTGLRISGAQRLGRQLISMPRNRVLTFCSCTSQHN
jgi:hypothetical protein